MRNQEMWISTIYSQISKQFSPRIRQDLTSLTVEPLQPTDRSYYIYGRVGSGKTLVAVKTYLEVRKELYLTAEEDKKCYFISVPEFFNDLKRSYSMRDNKDQELLEKYSDAYLLVLDDLGIEKVSDWALQTLYLLINRRYEWMRPTIITSNISLEEMATMLGDDRITSRIFRMCEIVRMDKTFTNK